LIAYFIRKNIKIRSHVSKLQQAKGGTFLRHGVIKLHGKLSELFLQENITYVLQILWRNKHLYASKERKIAVFHFWHWLFRYYRLFFRPSLCYIYAPC